ncbi:MAG: DNA mismatch repair protein MutS, partial [Chitinophagales bacterium]
MSGFTPMIEQYRNIKKEYADCILFFRLGDFYEMFFDDAELASRELDIVLTARDGGQCKVPMCGVPYHAATGYIGKLLDKGYRVAVCDQMEDPALAKGIVKREVTRVVTPGTALDDAWLKEDNNYLTALLVEEEMAALAYVDVSTGEFGACQFTGSGGIALLRDELARLRPRECLVPQWSKESTVFFDNNDFREVVLTETAPELFTAENAKHLLQKYFGSHALNVSGLERMPVALKAAGAILGFIEETQRTYMSQIKYIRTYHVTDYLGLDQASR